MTMIVSWFRRHFAYFTFKYIEYRQRPKQKNETKNNNHNNEEMD